MALKTYRYKQINPQGKIIRGFIVADGAHNIAGILEQNSNHLLKLRELSWVEALIRRPSISAQELLNLTSQCLQLLKAGVAIQEVIRIIANVYSSNFIHSSLMQIRSQILSGAKLSHALRAQPLLFDTLYCHTIQVGEEQGGLIQAFEKLVVHLQKRVELKRKFTKATFYPAVLLSMLVLLMSALSVFLLPQLKDFILSFGLEISLSTRILLTIAEKIEQYGGIICAFVVIAITSLAAFYVLSERFVFLIDRSLLNVPVLGNTLVLYHLLQYLIDFRIFANDGRSVLKALQQAPFSVTNHYLRKQFQDMSDYIHEGKTLASLFRAVPWVPEAITQMINVGESSGQLTQALVFCEEFVQNDLWSNVEKYLRLVEPLLLLMIGGFLLWIVISVFLPLYDQLGVI